jgi:DNA polymerase III subunit epsilon
MFWKNWFPKQQTPSYPPFWQHYLSYFDRAIEKDTLLSELEFVVFDTETTGLDTLNDKILSIGAVTIAHGEIQVANSFECYIHQSFTENPSIAIHGIMPHNHYTKLNEAEAIEQFLAYIQDKILIGHHVGFDIAILNQAIQKILPDKLKNYAFDTAMLYHRLKYPLQQSYSPAEDYTLDALSGQFNISISDRHTAAGDAFITAILFLKLLDRLQKQGVTTLRKLMR